MADFTTANPVVVGAATMKPDHMDKLDDNNARLLAFFKVQHKFHGAGLRGGRHFGLSRYAGNGSVAGGADETTILSQTDTDFNVGMWEYVIILGDFVATWRLSDTNNIVTFTEYADSNTIGNLDMTGYVYKSGGITLKYATALPSPPYVKLVLNTSTGALTLSVKPAGSTLPWAYAVYRISS